MMRTARTASTTHTAITVVKSFDSAEIPIGEIIDKSNLVRMMILTMKYCTL